MNPRILQPSDKDQLLRMEQELLMRQILDPDARALASWLAKWRPESLDFYLPNGWCMGCVDLQDKIHAYVLAQPILFFRGLAQTLWVEHQQHTDKAAFLQLFETVLTLGREKHLQGVCMSLTEDLVETTRMWKPQRQSEHEYFFKTARF